MYLSKSLPLQFLFLPVLVRFYLLHSHMFSLSCMHAMPDTFLKEFEGRSILDILP